jgi:hypothetical protein
MIIPSNLADIAGVIKTASSVIHPPIEVPTAAPTVVPPARATRA